MIKSVRLTKSNRAEEWALSDTRLELEAITIKPGKTRPSTGADDKRAERDIRDMLLLEGIAWSRDLRARSINRDDIKTRDADGNQVVIEVKHGGGALAYASQYDLESFDTRDRDLCLQGVDYVAYCLTADITDRAAIACTYRVARREDFLDMLEEYCHGKRKGGWDTATKFNNATHTAIQIQSMYKKEFWNGMRRDPRTMTLMDFCLTVLGRKPRMER